MKDTARIALVVDGDAVRGTLEYDGRREGFRGWLDLMARVEELRRESTTGGRGAQAADDEAKERNDVAERVRARGA